MKQPKQKAFWVNFYEPDGITPARMKVLIPVGKVDVVTQGFDVLFDILDGTVDRDMIKSFVKFGSNYKGKDPEKLFDKFVKQMEKAS